MPAIPSGPDADEGAGPSTPPDVPRPHGGWWRSWWPVVVALAVVLVALGVHVAPWVTEGFGVSHDGYNGAMWGLSGRAAWSDPWSSRLGGIQPDGDRYANHPPLIVWTTAVAGGITGESGLGLRAPAVVASAAALAILARLLADAGLRPAAVAGGLLLAGTSAMFLTYGALLDTPVLSLPFGLAVVALAQRAWQGRAGRPWIAVGVAALAGLAGWQAVVAAGVAAGACLLAPKGVGRRTAAALTAGLVAGTVLSVAWIWWVWGSLDKLVQQGRLRGGEAVHDSWWDAQRAHLDDLFGPVLVALVVAGGVAALAGAAGGPGAGAAGSGRSWWRGAGPLTAVLLVTVLAYTVGFRQASAEHDYWAFWGVAVVATTTASGLDVLGRALARAPVAGARTGAALAGVAVVVVAASGLLSRSDADHAIQDGLHAVPVLDAVPRAEHPDQVTMAVRHGDRAVPWARFATRGTVLTPPADALDDLPVDLPLFIVTSGPPDERVRAHALAVDGRFAVLRAGDYQTIVRGR